MSIILIIGIAAFVFYSNLETQKIEELDARLVLYEIVGEKKKKIGLVDCGLIDMNGTQIEKETIVKLQKDKKYIIDVEASWCFEIRNYKEEELPAVMYALFYMSEDDNDPKSIFVTYMGQKNSGEHFEMKVEKLEEAYQYKFKDTIFGPIAYVGEEITREILIEDCKHIEIHVSNYVSLQKYFLEPSYFSFKLHFIYE